jgi:hypothetical protein
VECIAVGLGIDRDRLYSHATGSLDNPAGDLAAICDQDSFEHGLVYLQPLGGVQPRGRQSGTRGWMEQFRRTAKLNRGNGCLSRNLPVGRLFRLLKIMSVSPWIMAKPRSAARPAVPERKA